MLKEQRLNSPESYSLWYGDFINHLPSISNRAKLASHIQNTEIPYSKTTNLRFSEPQSIIQILQQGFVPSPGEYDIGSSGNTTNHIIDTWAYGGKSSQEKTSDQYYNKLFGSNNWIAVKLDQTNHSSNSPMTEPLLRMPFIKKEIVQQLYGDLVNQKYSRYSGITSKILP
jgi:hypothetical protein